MTTSNDNQLCVQVNDVEDDDDECDSDDDDAFTFQKRSFGKRSLTSMTTDTPVKSKSRKRQQGSVGRDQQRAALSRKSRETIKKVLKIATADSDTDPDDDDSDVEVAGSTKKPPVPPPAPVVPAINILVDSSDDDDDDRLLPAGQTSVHSMETNGVRKETCQALLKARTAKLELEKAQNYHAEDIYVPVEGSTQAALQYSTHYRQGGTYSSNIGMSSVATSFSSPVPTLRTPVSVPASANLGPTLHITMRSVNVVDGKKSSPTCDNQTIRKNEPFSALLSRFLAAKQLAPTSTHVTMKFDGQTIDLSKTPALYDMDDEDMIDCEIRITAPSAVTIATAAATPIQTHPSLSKANLGPALKITLRSVTITADGKKSPPTSEQQTIRKNELFEALQSRYLVAKKLDPSLTTFIMKFDGQTIAMSKTPAFYDMDDEDMVDCEIRVTAAAPATPGNVGGRSCRLKLVTSTKKKARQAAVHVLNVNVLNAVQVLVDQYMAAHKLAAKAKVTLKFDGQVMNLGRTIDSYGVEDDDQIDVTVK